MSALIERVVTALVSDDLRLRETACDLDKVIASGWSGRSRSLGALAFRSRYTLDVERTRQLLRSVSRLALAKARQKKGGAPVRKLSGLLAACAFGGCRTSAGHAQGAAAWSLATSSTSATSSAKHAGAPASRLCRRSRTQGLSGTRTSSITASESSLKRWTWPLRNLAVALLAR